MQWYWYYGSFNRWCVSLVINFFTPRLTIFTSRSSLSLIFAITTPIWFWEQLEKCGWNQQWPNGWTRLAGWLARLLSFLVGEINDTSSCSRPRMLHRVCRSEVLTQYVFYRLPHNWLGVRMRAAKWPALDQSIGQQWMRWMGVTQILQQHKAVIAHC